VESVGRPEEARGFYTLVVGFFCFFLDITGKSFAEVYPLTHIFFQNKVERDFVDGTRGPGGR
jgi:hypothetical protein